jgi:hypothetical protein
MTAPTANRAGFLPATGAQACGAATAATPSRWPLGVADHRHSCGFPVWHRGRSAARNLSARDRDAEAVVSLRDELDLLGVRTQPSCLAAGPQHSSPTQQSR